MTVRSYLKFLDNLSQKPEIKVNEDSRFHTSLSIFISFLSTLAIVITSMIFLNDVWSKKKINLIYNQDNRKYTNISLAGKHIGLMVTGPTGQDIPESSRIFNIKFKYWQIKIPAFSTGSLTVNAGNQNLNQQTYINTNNSNNNNSNLNSYQPKVAITDIEPNDCDTMEKINPG